MKANFLTYKEIKVLGKGAFSQVMLIEGKNGQLAAVKKISSQMFKHDNDLAKYVQEQIKALTRIRDQNVVQFYDVYNDNDYLYLAFQYCNGQNLSQFQNTKQDRVFSLEEATAIISQIIRGLEAIHQKNYVHRDLKNMNILRKVQNSGKQLFKISDFGFIKKIHQTGGVVVGTKRWMAPQIFRKDKHGFQVDMWALGVIFFYMLNESYPYEINQQYKDQTLRKFIIEQTRNYSYSKAVKNSSKKLGININPLTQDFFRRVFDPNPQTRLNFIQIRQHPLFRQYFPSISAKTRNTYFKYTSSFAQIPLQSSKSIKQNLSIKMNQTMLTAADSIQNSYNNSSVKTAYNLSQINKDKKRLVKIRKQLDKINFLPSVFEQFSCLLSGFIDPDQILMLHYLIIKMYLIYLFQILQWANRKSSLQYSNHKQWKTYIEQAVEKYSQYQYKLGIYYEALLKINPEKISLVNPKFKYILQKTLKNRQYQGLFEISFRTTTSRIYGAARQYFSQNIRYVYICALLTVCHGFNNLYYSSSQQLREMFPQYVTQTNSHSQIFQFVKLKKWMKTANKEQLKHVIKVIDKTFFDL